MPTIGNTPLIWLTWLLEPGRADIYVKYEGANPPGAFSREKLQTMQALYQ